MNWFHELNAVVLPLVFVAVALSIYCIRGGRPVPIVLGRWTLCISISIGSALLIREFGLSGRPLWAVASFCLVLWMLLETVYNWLAIDALSRSGLPMLPRFRKNDNANEWPVDRSFITLREELRREHFKFSLSAIGQIGESDVLRCPVFEREDLHRRLTVYFIPTSSGRLLSYFSISTLLKDGRCIVTDNVFMPYGGFYPDDMYVERHPMVRRLSALLKIHERRVAGAGCAEAEWTSDPLADLNTLQHELEQLNVSLGYFVEPELREEYGNISREGRYRLWKEVWMLNYFGRPFSY